MATQPFDAAGWFATWFDHGGVALLVGDALWIGRTAAHDMEATQRLQELRAPLSAPEARSALVELLRANAAQSEPLMEG